MDWLKPTESNEHIRESNTYVIKHCLPTQHIYNLRHPGVYRKAVGACFVPPTDKWWNELTQANCIAFKIGLNKSTSEQLNKI